MTSRHDPAGWRVLVVGTGGQGVLTAARVLCDHFVASGHEVVSGQLHGMAQRGGAVQSSVMIDGGISPVIRGVGADFVVGFEPVETARALPMMSPKTVVLMNTVPVIPYVLAQQSIADNVEAKYPDIEGLCKSIRVVTDHLFVLDATSRAVEAGSARALNMVMLGCLIGLGSLPCTASDFRGTIMDRMPAKVREINGAAFDKGVEFIAKMHVAGAAR